MRHSSVIPHWPLYSQFQVAIRFNDLKSIESLLKSGLDFDYRFGNTKEPALCICSKLGHYELARLLITNGCSVNLPDQNGTTALHFACIYIYVDIARLLIQNRANLDSVNLQGDTPLHLAVHQKSLGNIRH